VDTPLKDDSAFIAYELYLENEKDCHVEPYLSYPNDTNLSDPNFDFNLSSSGLSVIA
jgi:hypothetical protein